MRAIVIEYNEDGFDGARGTAYEGEEGAVLSEGGQF